MNNETAALINSVASSDGCCCAQPCTKAAIASSILPPAVLAVIANLAEDPHPESQLINVLHKIQQHFGYLPEAAMEEVSQLMQIPAAKISGVASFYHYFHLTQRGQFTINVCMGTACYVKGAEAILRKFKEVLGIELGETTTDHMFSLQQERCLGTCALAPVVKVGEKVYSQVTIDQVPLIINEFINMTQANPTKS